MSWAAWIALLILGLSALFFAVVQRGQRRQLEVLLERSNDKLERLQMHFNAFAPSEIVEQLSGAGGEPQAFRRQVTILFADLRGFTALCDRLSPEAVVPVLNGYFERMSAAIAEHHGHVTELVGDGILALFGALEANPWQAQDAVKAALRMRASLQRYNIELNAAGKPTLRMGIGIHSGDVVAGVMGNQRLSKFSVVGDAINVASRVEGLTRIHDVDILITDTVKAALAEGFALREMAATPIKGKPEPIRTFAVEPG